MDAHAVFLDSAHVSPRNLSVLLVEDSRVLAERLRETLLSVPGVQLAGTVDSEADAVALLQRQAVDVCCSICTCGKGPDSECCARFRPIRSGEPWSSC